MHVVTIPHPVVDGVAETSFIEGNLKIKKTELIQYLASVLPPYMVPKDIIELDEFPLNINGKVDRQKLIEKI